MEPERGPRLVTRSFAVLTLAALAYFTSYAMLIPGLPGFVEEGLGAGKVAVGVAVGAFGVTALLLRPLVGILGDLRGRRLLITAGAASVSASVLGLAATPGLVPVVLLRLVGGAGEAMFFVGAASAITDMAPPERRGEALSLFSVALYLGVAIGPFVSETLIASRGYATAFAVSAMLAALAFVLGIPTPETRPPAEIARARSGRRRLLHPAGVIPGAVMFTSVWGFAGYMAFVARYSIELGLSGARGVLLMYGLIMVAIRAFGARIPDRFGAARVGKAGLAASAAGLAIIGTVGSVAGLVAGSVVFAGGQALAFPAFMAMAASAAPPSERGAAVGTTTAFIDAGFFVGPVTFGFVASFAGSQHAFLLGAAVAVIGVAFQIALAARAEAAPVAAGS